MPAAVPGCRGAVRRQQRRASRRHGMGQRSGGSCCEQPKGQPIIGVALANGHPSTKRDEKLLQNKRLFFFSPFFSFFFFFFLLFNGSSHQEPSISEPPLSECQAAAGMRRGSHSSPRPLSKPLLFPGAKLGGEGEGGGGGGEKPPSSSIGGGRGRLARGEQTKEGGTTWLQFKRRAPGSAGTAPARGGGGGRGEAAGWGGGRRAMDAGTERGEGALGVGAARPGLGDEGHPGLEEAAARRLAPVHPRVPPRLGRRLGGAERPAPSPPRERLLRALHGRGRPPHPGQAGTCAPTGAAPSAAADGRLPQHREWVRCRGRSGAGSPPRSASVGKVLVGKAAVWERCAVCFTSGTSQTRCFGIHGRITEWSLASSDPKKERRADFTAVWEALGKEEQRGLRL